MRALYIKYITYIYIYKFCKYTRTEGKREREREKERERVVGKEEENSDKVITVDLCPGARFT